MSFLTLKAKLFYLLRLYFKKGVANAEERYLRDAIVGHVAHAFVQVATFHSPLIYVVWHISLALTMTFTIHMAC